MKKTLSLPLAILLTLIIVGCDSKKVTLSEFTTYPNTDLLYPVPLNLDWGMSKDEAFKALGLTDSQVKLNVFDDSQLDDTVMLLENSEPDRDTYTTTITCDGAEMGVILRFANKKHIDLYGADYGLISAEIAFNGKDTFDKINASAIKHTAKTISEACESANIIEQMLNFMDKRLAVSYPPESENNATVRPIPTTVYGKEPLSSISVKQGSGDGILVDDKDYEHMAFYRGLNSAFYNVTLKAK